MADWGVDITNEARVGADASAPPPKGGEGKSKNDKKGGGRGGRVLS